MVLKIPDGSFSKGVVKVADGMSVRLGDGKGAKAGKSGQSRARTAQAFPRSAPGPA